MLSFDFQVKQLKLDLYLNPGYAVLPILLKAWWNSNILFLQMVKLRGYSFVNTVTPGLEKLLVPQKRKQMPKKL